MNNLINKRENLSVLNKQVEEEETNMLTENLEL